MKVRISIFNWQKRVSEGKKAMEERDHTEKMCLEKKSVQLKNVLKDSGFYSRDYYRKTTCVLSFSGCYWKQLFYYL